MVKLLHGIMIEGVRIEHENSPSSWFFQYVWSFASNFCEAHILGIDESKG